MTWQLNATFWLMTIIVPGSELRVGKNSVVAIELEHVDVPVARFVAEPDLGVIEE